MLPHANVEKGVRAGDPEDDKRRASEKERRIMRKAHKVRQRRMMERGGSQKPDNVSIVPVKDGYAETKIQHWLFDLPFRVALVGRSESAGKTTWLLNMLIRFYTPSPWKGDDIYIISGTANADKKVEMLQRRLGIPKENVFSSYSEATLGGIYKRIQQKREKSKDVRSLIVLDDVTSHLMATQNSGVLGEMSYESRHHGVSLILLTQKWTNVPTGLRENLSGAVIWGCAQRQVQAIAHDLNRFDNPSTFFKMLKQATSGDPHDFMVVRINKPVRDMYLDTHFKPLRPEGTDNDGDPTAPQKAPPQEETEDDDDDDEEEESPAPKRSKRI